MKRCIAALSLALFAGALGACSEQSLVAPERSASLRRIAAPPGTYELTFHTTGNFAIGAGVESAPVNTEMALRANVRDANGNLATAGSVVFERCELAGVSAPSAVCDGGSGTWKRHFRIAMDASGYPPTVQGANCSTPRAIGFRFRYSGDGRTIADGASISRDFTWYDPTT
jgi:hypothetical protein